MTTMIFVDYDDNNLDGTDDDNDDGDNEDCLSPFKVGMNQFKSVIPLPCLVFHLNFQILQQII